VFVLLRLLIDACSKGNTFCCVLLSGRRRSKKATGNGTVAMEMAKNPHSKNNNGFPNYEEASDMTDNVPTLHSNGRLTSRRKSNAAGQGNGNNGENMYYNEPKFGGYDTVTLQPASQNDATSPAATYSQVNKKKADRTAQHGKGPKAAPRDGAPGKGSEGANKKPLEVCDSLNDTTLIDNALYANVSLESSPSSPPPPPASATNAESEQTDEPICTSINDFTLIDNDIYNS